MVIIHITIGFDGGVSTVIKNLINYQLKCGNTVGLAYPEHSQEKCEEFTKEFDGGILLFPQRVRQFKGASLIGGIPLKNMYKKLRKEYPGEKIVFHAHNPVSIGLINDIKSLPIICTLHGTNPSGSFISKFITSLILLRSRQKNIKFVGVSNSTSSYYSFIFKKDFIKTINNGVKVQRDISEYKFEKFTIGYISHIDNLKGWRYLYDAYTLLDNKYKKQINLIFAGSGNKDDISSLQELIRKDGLTENIKFLGEVKNAGNVLTPNLNLVILPSLSEGIPMTLLESIANCVPILATEVGGIPELLAHGKNGYFITRDPEDIAEKIQQIFIDKSLYNDLQLHCSKIYKEKFTIEKMGESYLDLYRDL